MKKSALRRIGAILLACVCHASAWAVDTTTSETPEVQFSSAAAVDLRTKAQALASPVAIYEYLRDNHEYALYHGSRGGSINTFLGQRGNDVDLASTLIAMLRAPSLTSTVMPARYAVSTVRMATPAVMNWLGVKNADLAASLMKNQGIQSVVLSLDKSTIDFEHIWVEVLAPFNNYRGSGAEVQTVNCVTTPVACHWIALDPSFKQHAYNGLNLDPYTALSFDYTAYYNAIKNNDLTRMNKNPLEIYQEQILAWLRTSYPGKTLGDVADMGTIIPEDAGILPASLPYTVAGVVRRYNSVADHDVAVPAVEPKKWAKTLSLNLSWTAKLTGGGTLSVSAGAGPVLLADLATKRLTVTNELTGGIPNVVVRLDGVEIARPISGSGTIVGYTPAIGDPFTLTVSMDGVPAITTTGVDQLISANYQGIIGGYYLIATGGEVSNWSQTHRATQQLLDANQQYPIYLNPAELNCQIASGANCTPYTDATFTTRLLDNKPALDALSGGMLYVAATDYYAKLRDRMAMADALNKAKTPIAGFLGVVSTTYQVEYINGTAFSVLPGGLLIDMKGITISGSWRIDQPAAVSDRQFEFMGHIMSSLEHETWQELTGYDAVSTVRGIQTALAAGATLLNPVKNLTTDTMSSTYAAFGFNSSPPANYLWTTTDGQLQPITMYGNAPAVWVDTNNVNGSSFDVLKKSVDLTTPSFRIPSRNYAWGSVAGPYLDYWLRTCFGVLQLGRWGSVGLSYWVNDPGTIAYGPPGGMWPGVCGVPRVYYNGPTFAQALYNAWVSAIVPTYFGWDYINFFDRSNGFVPTDHVYRAYPAPEPAQFTSFVKNIRDWLYLRDLTKIWVEYIVPSQQTKGANYKFAVDILKGHDTPTGNLIAAWFEIQNNTGIVAGGGYVPLKGNLLTTASSITLSGQTSIVPTFNNATMTNQNTIAQVNNDPIKTPSTADPVSTVTGNNYHDETDLTIKGRGLNIAFTRTYNSSPSATATAGVLGFGWTHSYAMKLKSNDYGACPNCTPAQAPENGNLKTSSITYTDERGGDHNYLVNDSTCTAATVCATTPPQGEFDSLAFDTPIAGQHTLTFRNGVKYIFESASTIKTTPGISARLKQIADPYGNQLNFGYDANGRLATVADNLGVIGRTGLTLAYTLAGNLASLTDWTGRQFTYGYDAAGNLTSVTNPNPLLQKTQYAYTAGTHNLTVITAPLARNAVNVATTFKYYQNGKTFNYTDSLNHAESLDYDLFRKTTRVTDPRGGIREYEYDEAGRMTKLSEPDGAVLLFENGADGLRTRKFDGLGYATQYSYRNDKSFNSATNTLASDTFGNVTREQDALARNVDTTYGIYDQVATVTDKRGTISTTAYFATTGGCALAGKPQSVTLSALSGVLNAKLLDYCWNADGTLASKTEYILPGNLTRKRTTSYTYQAGSNGLNVSQMTVTGATSGGSITVSYTYDTLGRKTGETLSRRTSATNAAPIAITTAYEYDMLDRVTAVIDALGNRVETVYDANGKVYQIIAKYKKPDATFDVRILSTRSYDAADRLILDTDVLGNSTSYQYDAAGNLASATDPEGHTTRYEYDAMNRRTATTDANGHRTATGYDLAGHITRVKNPNGETVSYSYDAIGQLTSLTDARGYITQYSYDPNGNRTCVIDANASASLQPKNLDGCSVYTVYDELNRPTQSKDALNGITLTGYDLLGHILSVTDATAKITRYVYDDLGRLTGSTDPLGKVASFTYDEAGNKLTSTNRLLQSTRASYDVLNRPTLIEYLTDATSEAITYDLYGNRLSVGNGMAVYTYTYDLKNRLLSKTDTGIKTLSFTYDKAGNILTKTDYQNHITEYRYDSANRLVSLKNPEYLEVSYQYDGAGRLLSRILSNGAQSSYTYDPDGGLATLKQQSADGTVLSNTSYMRDRVGNITGQTEAAGAQPGSTGYSYDALYRLTAATYPGTGNSEAFTYDAAGNRLTHTQGAAVHAYEYWTNSNRLKAVHTTNLAGAIEKSFTYDDEGRMITQTGTGAKTLSWDQKGRAKTISANARTVSYQYDPLDYRIGSYGASTGNADYFLEGEYVEAIYSGNLLQAEYLRGTSPDELVAGWSFDAAGSWKPAIYHHDNVMSVTGISAHTGAVLEKVSYGAFGNVLSDTATATTNTLRYTGRESDTDTGLYYYRARYYDNSIGRFISEDPLGFKAGMNFYAYVNNNPVNGNDPSGLCPAANICQAALNVAGANTSAVTQANANWGTIQSAAAANGIAPALLAAIGVRETGFRSIAQIGGGQGAGVFQIDLGQNPNVTSSQAYNTTFAANFAANMLATNNATLAAEHPNFSPTQLQQATAASYNFGTGNISGNPNTIDVGTTGGNYGSNVLGLMTCFCSANTSSSVAAASNTNANAAAAGGFLIYPNKPNTNQMQRVYSK